MGDPPPAPLATGPVLDTNPHDYLFNMNHPASARNHAGVDDPRLTAMIDDEEKTLDEAGNKRPRSDASRSPRDGQSRAKLARSCPFSTGCALIGTPAGAMTRVWRVSASPARPSRWASLASRGAY